MVVKQYASEDVLQALIESQQALVLSEQSADREIHRLRELLSQSQKDLEIARKALDLVANGRGDGQAIMREYEKGKFIGVREICRKALEQINHIADASNMVEHKE